VPRCLLCRTSTAAETTIDWFGEESRALLRAFMMSAPGILCPFASGECLDPSDRFVLGYSCRGFVIYLLWLLTFQQKQRIERGRIRCIAGCQYSLLFWR
jgi:hypothetical protein